jgi:hypothetical protein
MKQKLTEKEAGGELAYYQMMAVAGYIDEDLLQPIARFIAGRLDPEEHLKHGYQLNGEVLIQVKK